jgi:hypothetical protein
MVTELKRIAVYLTEAELDKVKDKADEKGQALSAYVRSRLGFKEKLRGAPEGNRNAAGKRQTRRWRQGKATGRKRKER